MKRFTIIISLFSITSLAFWFCQKKLFKRIHATGRLLNYYTKEPIIENVSLVGDDATSSKNSQERSRTMCSDKTDENGYFDIKSNASRRNHYYIYVRYWEEKTDNSWYSPYAFTCKENGTTDLGDFLIGSHT